MDLRTERTKRSIANAFLELRKHKPLEKISVKELAELACQLQEEDLLVELTAEEGGGRKC